MAPSDHTPPILRVVTESTERFGGDGKWSGATHLFTAAFAFITALTSGLCLWVLTDVKATAAEQARELGILSSSIASETEMIKSDEYRIGAIEEGDVRSAAHTQKQDELIISHEAKIEAIREQVEALQRKR